MLMKKKDEWKFELLTEEFDCDKKMIDYVKYKIKVKNELKRKRMVENDNRTSKAAKVDGIDVVDS